VLRLMRPRQWTKNLLLFAALVFAGQLFHPSAFLTACLAFAAFCLASSSVYVVNDVLDVERDRLHPEKRRRPVASGRVSRGAAIALAAGLTAASLALGFGIGRGFGITVVIYLAFSHFYSLVGKNVVILDIVLIAIGFVLRAVAGAEAIEVPFSNWFILCTFFVALFIAISKRKAELSASGDATGTRPVLAHYTGEALGTFTAAAMAAAVISYSLYVQDVLAKAGAQRRPLLFTVPFVILAIFRYYLLVERDAAGERPEDVLLTDRPLQLCVLGFVVLAVAAFYGG
jgi:4-hydroxybenzoate polyprenyltransferase